MWNLCRILILSLHGDFVGEWNTYFPEDNIDNDYSVIYENKHSLFEKSAMSNDVNRCNCIYAATGGD